VPPLGWHLVLRRDRIDGTGLDAGVAVDALVGVYVELLSLRETGLLSRRMDAVDGANLGAAQILRPDAGLVDHIRHRALLFKLGSFLQYHCEKYHSRSVLYSQIV
jgi:hypothetical protein